ncbi:MAG: hypothetical protein KDA80_03770 [Planctomycetaceae bacterium]|nr:hypothetical protein [Planctomycetaceae bacterium]
MTWQKRLAQAPYNDFPGRWSIVFARKPRIHNGLVHHRGSFSLISPVQQHNEVGTFKVDRISKAALDTLKFQKTKDFDHADLTEAKYWILSFGAKATVKEPEELRDEVPRGTAG